ncbi:LysR family transcriptional regulator [Shimwellia pseudoproteus]|uniref:LysR substrate-binding domain-containing protein n=1 Tax=Shimwellia pseudoproteus TaxID=570012 RepID=UPI0018EADE7D|nr:LysR substrate-binding domain-containing protein [Shimwellia pseudoproteus]MBJ3816547.1 LysR family transcriptional regulator [Shimwellia pseudoproteus]
MLQDLNDLYYFARVVERGGFAEASRATGIPRSTLSRRIAALEERLGVRLIQRSTRRFNVTDIGWQYYQHCQSMTSEAQAAQMVIERVNQAPRGNIRFSCHVVLLHSYVGAIVADYMHKFPEVTIEVEATNRRVDVIGEGFDLALRVLPPPLEDSELIVKYLGRGYQIMVASPALLEKYGQPETLADLGAIPLLGVSQKDERMYGHWRLTNSRGEEQLFSYRPRLASDDLVMLHQAVLAGLGITILPRMMITSDLADRRLIPVLPEWQPDNRIIHALYGFVE